VPIGACLAHGEPPSCSIPAITARPSAAIRSPARQPGRSHVIKEKGLCANAAREGEYLLSRLRERLAGIDDVVAVRGCGLMLGIELTKPCGDLVKARWPKACLSTSRRQGYPPAAATDMATGTQRAFARHSVPVIATFVRQRARARTRKSSRRGGLPPRDWPHRHHGC